MRFNLILTYKDEKTVNIILAEEKIQKFFDDIGEGKVHYNTETKVGFWTSFSELKHIIVKPVEEENIEAKNEQKRESGTSDQDVSEGNKNLEAGESVSD